MTDILGDTIRIKATIKDYDKITLIAPDSHSIKFYDPSGTLKGTYTTPTEVETGIYTQDHDTSASDEAGIWSCRWTAVKGSASQTEDYFFKVKA